MPHSAEGHNVEGSEPPGTVTSFANSAAPLDLLAQHGHRLFLGHLDNLVWVLLVLFSSYSFLLFTRGHS